MKRNPRWVILSPHLDDAALSLGGLIAALRSLVRVEVWTLFCGATFRGPYSELATWLHESSGGPTGSRLSWQREREDRGACKRLGANAKHFPWKDSPYRKRADGKFMYNGTQCSEWHNGDEPMVQSIAGTLAKSFQSSDVVLAPLGVGGHVDHLITRHVAEAALPKTLLYYPEVPYVVSFAHQLPQKTERLCAIEYALTKPQIEDWIGAVRCYVSQMRMLEQAVGPVPELVHRYATTTGLSLYRPAEQPALGLAEFGIFRYGAASSA